MKKLTTEEFINRAKNVHGNTYNYDKVEYDGLNKKVIIGCKIHGDFSQTANNHLQGQGCPSCKGGLRDTTESFIRKAKEIHGDTYDYSRVDYINSTTEIIIGCPTHGLVNVKPINHLHYGCGCPECSQTKKLTTEEFINRAKNVHGDLYSYDKVKYINAHTYIIIHCNRCNCDFTQSPHDHLSGHGCSKCNGGVRHTQEEFIQKSHEVHGNLYEYDKVNYINCLEPVLIKCQKHGYFLQSPIIHTMGSGCPVCNASKLELEVRKYCIDNNINFHMFYTWDWLINIKAQEVDFYLPDFNAVIECQGYQHFGEVEFFNQRDSLKNIQTKDENKRNLCLKHGIRVFYFSDMIRNNKAKSENFSYPYKVYEDINELFKNIIDNLSD